MALSATNKAYLAEILGIPHPNLVASELTGITAEQEAILTADITRWLAVRGRYGSLNGHNASGVEFDPADERGDIRRRIIRMLDCAETVNAYRTNSAGLILRA